jgi:hypothetical protein
MRFLAFGCLHHPVADPAALRFLHDQIESFQPDVLVNLGDWYDGEGWSRWDNENPWTIIDEYRAARDHARILNAFSFIKKFVWLYGNHEANISEPGRLKKSQRDIVDWQDWSPPGGGLRDEVRDWHVVRKYGSSVRWNLGPISFTHGTKANVYSARDEARMHCVPHGLTISAHSHRPVHVTRDSLAGNQPADLWYANVGTGIDVSKARYIQRSNFQGWGMAVVCGEIYSKDSTLLKEGRKVFRSKVWDAQTHVLGIQRDRLNA